VDNKVNIKQKEFLGSGWSFPVTFSLGNHQLDLTQYENSISDSIDVIMKTSIGERPLVPQFGSGLEKFFFEKMSPTMKGDIRNTVKNALLENEPRITVNEVTVEFTNIESGLVEVAIDYEYNKTNTRHNYVYPFHLKEGTNL
jgi:phage baseplate assembly protein W